ncbi:hypothetical protein [Shewanella sp. Isolate8]|uniref:hypothetical protein n=1 Tax=Shewanella sp. Isolate8 TaxID=2908529 RepID=UPI001EFDFC25|nr:hypothetical protein [Shewanella sp. Isolate8]MCG9746429.1 hypothetical protein [Shewanella sp. Isolate8]
MSAIKDIRINKFELKLADTDDPVAEKTSWDPLKSGGANFKTQDMVETKGRIVIKHSVTALILYSMFLLPGLGIFFIVSPTLFLEGESGGGSAMAILGALFIGVSLLMLSSKKHMTFDKTLGTYFCGKSYDGSKRGDASRQGRLSDIHALQLISESIRSNNRSYRSYELNLVFRNGERANVMDHGSELEIEASAKLLAAYLDRPLWKAT